jgi:hypothetical protein
MELFFYDPCVGLFINKVQRSNIKVGAVAGTVEAAGYIVIRVDRKDYKAHRLAWLYMMGCFPASPMDHIDRDRANNKFENFRLASYADNAHNASLYKKSSSGFKGVSRTKCGRKWKARITTGGKSLNLGEFISPEAAHAAYCSAAQKHFGEFASAGVRTEANP